jgi:hypothetical protein
MFNTALEHESGGSRERTLSEKTKGKITLYQCPFDHPHSHNYAPVYTVTGYVCIYMYIL